MLEENPPPQTRTPLWKAIVAALKRDIAAGRFVKDGKLPTEAQLARRFGVNRHTVRRALGVLAEEGVVQSRRGSGVFITVAPVDYKLGRRVRFHQNIAAIGQAPEKTVLALETRIADAREAAALELDEGDLVHVYFGLSWSDGHPIALFRSVFPAARFPHLLHVLEDTTSVTAALARTGVADYTRASTRINATRAGVLEARHLRLREGAPLLRTVSINVDTNAVPVEYGRTWYSGDAVTLTLEDQRA